MFSWIPIYTELAKKLLPYRDRQSELIEMLKALEADGIPVGSIVDRDNEGKEIPLAVIDPFTFYASFNRGLTTDNRRRILAYLKTKFDLESEVPADFEGIPVVDARRAWFFPYKNKRKSDDISSLWALGEAVVQGPPEDLDSKLFERCLQVETVGPAKLTMGMFWLNPKRYIACDSNCRKFFKLKGIDGEVETLSSYLQLVKNVNAKLGTEYPEISRTAWETANPGDKEINRDKPPQFAITPQQLEKLWTRFNKRISGFTDFGSPGDRFHEEELDYKRNALKRYEEEIGNAQLRKLVQAGQGNKAREEISRRITTNLVAYQSWRPSIGSDDEKSSVVLRAFLDAAETPYAGPSTVEPIVQAIVAQGMTPHWDTLSTLLWAMRPSDYFPVKIKYYRKLAEELGHPLPDGPPTGERFDQVLRFGQAFWRALEAQNPADWVDVQSFIWVVCPTSYKDGTAGPEQPSNESEEESTILNDESSAMNLILYGPPGTGKTYETIERAVKVIDPAFARENSGNRVAQKRRFDELVLQGQVEFITFHQSYSYEDFVEGIRPVLDADEEGGPPRYECRPGAFKRLAFNALFDCLERAEAAKGLVPFDALWKALLAKIESDPEAKYRGLSDKTSYQLALTQKGNIEGVNVLSDKKFLCSRKILEQVFDAKRSQDAVTVSEVMEVVARGCHSQLVAAVFNELRRIEKSQFRGKVQPPRPTAHTEDEKAEIVQRFLAEGEKSGYQLKPESHWNRFVLVIDEINRGNISKILGELITLIEPDKRLRTGDNQNSLVVTLPYSGEKFAVPANLYVVGTMNTADKSIALVDVALRRRFEFEELRVDLTLCSGLSEKMRSVLQELNRRIALRKDRDHQIGHAYFIRVEDEARFNQCFRKQIIPLLQEYFYNDWDGLRYVLGENSGTVDGGFIRKISGADVKEARTKWQWFFDADAGDIGCLQTLCSSYSIV
ncbi:MAG TPA: AAA family ATPase [Terriglobales bacterium]|jgi:hypothetical protein